MRDSIGKGDGTGPRRKNGNVRSQKRADGSAGGARMEELLKLLFSNFYIVIIIVGFLLTI